MTALARPLLPSEVPSGAAAGARSVALAFEAVYAQHARFIAGIVQRMVGRTHAEVDDLVQETFIDAVDGLAKIRNPEDPSVVRAWLATVAVRRARRFLGRARRRAIFAFLSKEYGPRASDPRVRQPVDDLYDALDRLPADLRIAWSLHRIEEWSLPQTAAVCEVSLATVKRRIAEAEHRLERRLTSPNTSRETSLPSTPSEKSSS